MTNFVTGILATSISGSYQAIRVSTKPIVMSIACRGYPNVRVANVAEAEKPRMVQPISKLRVSGPGTRASRTIASCVNTEISYFRFTVSHSTAITAADESQPLELEVYIICIKHRIATNYTCTIVYRSLKGFH